MVKEAEGSWYISLKKVSRGSKNRLFPNDNEHQDEWNAYNEYIANRTLSGELAYGPELDGRMKYRNGELIPIHIMAIN